MQNLSALSAFVTSIAAFSGASALQRTHTEVRFERGRGLSRILGLGRRTVTTTTVEVDKPRVLAAAAAAGIAGAAAYRVAGALKRWLLRRQRHQVAVRLQGFGEGSPQASEGADLASGKAPAEVVWVHTLPIRSVGELRERVQRLLPSSALRGDGPPELRFYSAEDRRFVPVSDEAIRRIPKIASLQLSFSAAGRC